MKNKSQKGHKQHKVKVTKWVGGVLITEEFVFETYELAVIESKKHKGNVKIYDCYNQIIFSEQIIYSDNETYA